MRLQQELSLKDLFLFFKQRRIIALLFFLLGVSIGVLKIAPSLGQIHLQQNIMAQVYNREGQFTPTYILKLRQHYLDDPFLRRELVLNVKTSKLSVEKLEQMIDVKIRTMGGFIGRNNQPSERFLIALYVLTSNDALGREILSVWTKLCFDETEKLNQLHRERLQELHAKVAHYEAVLEEAMAKFSEKAPEIDKMERTFPSSESFAIFIKQRYATLKKKMDVDTDIPRDPQDPRHIYAVLRDQLLTYLSITADASNQLATLKNEIKSHQSEMVALASEPEIVTVLNRKDLFLQLVAISLALGILLSLLGTSVVAILSAAGREKINA